MATFTIANEGITIRCHVPDGITIGKTKYGQGVFASRHFVKGQVLYTGHFTLLDDDGVNRDITLITDDAEYPMTTEMHTVGVGVEPNKKREMFYFDAFMNHSCEPNTYSADSYNGENGGSYKTVALRDISPGDEITCDYDLFELDSRDKGIDKCECGSSLCRGYAHGFLYLPKALQIELSGRMYQEVIDAWVKMCPNVMFESVCPPRGLGIQYDSHDGSMHLVATKDYQPGEKMYSYSSLYFDSNVIDTIILKVTVLPTDETCGGNSDSDSGHGVDTSNHSDNAPATDVEMWIEPPTVVRQLVLLDHTVNRGDGMREYFGYDTFCDHSCDPNVHFVYVNGSKTETVTSAARSIKTGDRVLCNYSLFDEGRDGTEFICDCGADNCLGIIRG
jgi:hypothetical protein